MRIGAAAAIALLPVTTGGCIDWASLRGYKCGNGVADPGEECDDGNRNDADACLSTCRWAHCGDGQVRLGVEECDPGIPSSSEGCSAACLRCPALADTFWGDENDHCYALRREPLGWADARKSCDALGGGDLLTINNQWEADTVFAHFLRGTVDETWIGLHDRAENDQFVWVSGEPMRVDWWASGEPVAGVQDCAFQSPLPNPTEPGYQAAWRTSVCGAGRGAVCERAAPTVRPLDRHAYRTFAHTATWDEARASCQALHGDLAVITDLEGEAFVSSLALLETWIGASDRSVEGVFRWVTGEPVTYQSFAPGEPNDVGAYGKDDCVILGVDRVWHDRSCQDRYAYVCEID